MAWRGNELRSLSLMWDNLVGPGALYSLERQFWLDLWRTPIVEAIEESGIEVRHYGPVLAFVSMDTPRTPQLNLVLGASQPGAVEEGHLEEALDWVESRGVDCSIPVRPDFEESAAAEEHLNQRHYRCAVELARFVRDAAPPDFPEPPGLEVDEWAEETEGFSDYMVEGLGLERSASAFFDSLLGRRYWRCYVGIDENDLGTGAATMMLHHEVAQLGFASTKEAHRRRGSHMALLRRRIVDAAAAGSTLLFADTEEPAEDPDRLSTAARNLVRAGFKMVSARPLWRPPAEAVVQPEDEEDFDEDFDDEGPDEDDHDFDLEE